MNADYIVFAMMSVAVFFLFATAIFMMDIPKETKQKAVNWFAVVFIFAALVSVWIYYYQEIDKALYSNFTWITFLTRYDVQGFGLVHIPTLLLSVWLAVAFALAWPIQQILFQGIDYIVERLSKKQAPDDGKEAHSS